MDKKPRIIICSLFILILVLVSGYSVLAQTEIGSFMAKWGQTLVEYSKGERVADTELYAKGKTVEISNEEVQQATDFYVLSGLESEEAKDKAINYVMQREALYEEALRAGYVVTDTEVRAYLEQLKGIIDKADNREDAYAVMAAFDSEQEYWDFQFTVYQKDLPIQKYVESLKTQYEVQTGKTKSSSDFMTGFNEYYEEVKQELVQKENFQKVNE